MSFAQFVEENFASLIGITFMLLLLLNDRSMEKDKKWLFYVVFGLSLLEMLVDTLEANARSAQTYTYYRVVWSAIGYSLRPLLVYLVLLLSMRGHARTSTLWLLSLPAVVNALISLSALFCNVAFSYTSDNHFIRGPLGMTPLYTLGFYFVAVVANEMWQNRRKKLTETINIVACVLVCATALYIQYVTDNTAVGRIALVYCLMFFYMLFQSKQYRIQNAEEKFRAEHDALTTLYNREAFMRCAKEYEQQKTPLLFMVIDVDHFKTVNDTHGHEVGDFVLEEIAELLKAQFRASDLLFRIGGDEFAVMIPSPPKEWIDSEIAPRMKRINLALSKHPHGLPVTSLSTGAAYSAAGYTNELYGEADRALYETKNACRGGCTIHYL